MTEPSGQFATRTYRRTFDNGLTLLVLENHANPTVEIRGSLRGGLYFGNGRGLPYGTPQVTAAMLMRGSRRHSKIEIAQDLEDVGADLEISAGRFLVHFSGRCLGKDLDRLLSTGAEVLREPSFPEEELERLRHQVVGTIRRSQEDTSVRAFERLSQLVYSPANPFYERPAEDRIAAVEQLRCEDLERFYGDTYGAGYMIVVVAGDVDTRACEARLMELCGSWRRGPELEIDVPRSSPDQPGKSEWVVMADKSSVDIVLGHAGQLRRKDPTYYAAMLANAALGQSTLSSRLGLRVRDQEGLSYGIVSRFFEAGSADGPWGINVTVNPENVDRAIASALEVLDRYVSEGIEPTELENEKSAFAGSFLVGLGTNAGIASQLHSAERYGFGPAHLDQFPELLERVSLSDVNSAIHAYFKPRALFTVMAGQPPKPL